MNVTEPNIKSPANVPGSHFLLAKMFHDLRTHASLRTAFENGSGSIDETHIVYHLCTIERSIDSFVHGGLDRAGSPSLSHGVSGRLMDMPLRPCGVVGSIYIYMFLRKIPVDNPVFDYMVSLVREELERFDAELLQGMFPPEIMFWMLFVAGVASLKREERPWFVMRLRREIRILGLKGWQEVRGLLGRLAWVDGVEQEGGRQLWGFLEGEN